MLGYILILIMLQGQTTSIDFADKASCFAAAKIVKNNPEIDLDRRNGYKTPIAICVPKYNTEVAK